MDLYLGRSAKLTDFEDLDWVPHLNMVHEKEVHVPLLPFFDEESQNHLEENEPNDVDKQQTKSYCEFLTLLKENTGSKLDDYKTLCRLCLKNQSNGIDISATDCNTKEQRDVLLNNYILITKRYVSNNRLMTSK